MRSPSISEKECDIRLHSMNLQLSPGLKVTSLIIISE